MSIVYIDEYSLWGSTTDIYNKVRMHSPPTQQSDRVLICKMIRSSFSMMGMPPRPNNIIMGYITNSIIISVIILITYDSLYWRIAPRLSSFWVFGFLGFWVFGFLGFWVFGFLGSCFFGFLSFGFILEFGNICCRSTRQQSQ
jgi:hypothetical protein